MKFRQIFFTGIAIFAISSPVIADNYNCDYSCESCCPCTDWTFSADWLYWETRRSDLDYVVKGTNSVTPTGATLPVTLPNGKARCVDPSWDSGFRLGLFKRCDKWKFGVRWTSYNTTESSTTKSPTDADLSGTRGFARSYAAPQSAGLGTILLPVNATTNGLRLAKSKYKIDLDVIDFEAAYYYPVECSDITLWKFFGIKYATIDQKMDTFYSNLIDFTSVDTIDGMENAQLVETNAVDRVKEKLQMDAIGGYLGIEGIWDFCSGFNAFGAMSGGIYIADFDAEYKVNEFDRGVVGNQLERIKKDQCLGVAHFDVKAGLGYDFCECGCFDFSLQVGYEIHQWINMPDFINPVDFNQKLARNKSNLGFDGLFVRLNTTF